MVMQFVGFMGAFREPGGRTLRRRHLRRPAHHLGDLRAVFLVDFPRRTVRRDHTRQPGAAAALATITAAVVGVVLNLAVWFALHVLFAEVREVPCSA